MKRLLTIAGVIVAIIVLAGSLTGTALAWGPGGPGGYGCGMGGPGPMGGWYGPLDQSQSISFDEAVKKVQDYVASVGNTDLVVDEVMEFEYNFYAIVNERSTGVGAFELLVNKRTGWVYPEMGPNMMWNTKYGHMGYRQGFGMMGGRGMMGGYWGANGYNGPWAIDPAEPMTVTPEKASQLATDFLNARFPGATPEEPHKFYGYYTLDFQKDGKIAGMLSVNGYTGQVWYHSWHGEFVQEKEL